MKNKLLRPLFLLLAFGMIAGLQAQPVSPNPSWSRENVQAWCIVPYDAKKRNPEQRAQMLLDLGIKRYAYDFREEHVPTFDQEVEVMKKAGIEITAWWFPTTLNKLAQLILDVIKRHGIKPELWVTGSGDPAPNPAAQAERVTKEAARIRPIAEAAAGLGCKVLLYNHGGWFGDPENQVQVVAVLRAAGITNVGIVYNFHHGHDHIRNFARIWPRISREVMAVNFSGMVVDGDRQGRKIIHLGTGNEELTMMRTIYRSGWRGSVGILSHIAEFDAAETLKSNLAGYDKLLARLQQEATQPAPAAK